MGHAYLNMLQLGNQIAIEQWLTSPERHLYAN